jgi:hypothetical protein
VILKPLLAAKVLGRDMPGLYPFLHPNLELLQKPVVDGLGAVRVASLSLVKAEEIFHEVASVEDVDPHAAVRVHGFQRALAVNHL